jgi:dolichyl-phosphate beta-glucosyltransferase
MRSEPELSVVVPLYNEEKRLYGCMARLISQLRLNLIPAEIILVCNGCTDRTEELARRYAGQHKWIHVLSIAERGKGAAVRAGMLTARGKMVYMADVDLSTPAKEIYRFMVVHEQFGFDVVVGSREIDRSKVKATFKRRVIGRCFHLLTALLVPGIQDTQCGFKLFSAAAAKDIFSNATVNGLAFDVEALYLARRMGYTIYELPVTWEDNPDSRVNLFTDSLEMLTDVLKIPLSHARPISAKVPA